MPTIADSRPINLILNANETPIIVPRLQRPFSWDSAETRELWQDLVAFDRRYPGALIEGKEYFLGCLVGRITTGSDSHERLEVLDGQQRLATLTILFATLRDLLAESNAQVAQQIQTMNIEQFVGLNATPRYVLTLNRVDSEFFRNRIQVWPRPDGYEAAPVRTASHRLIVKARQFFDRQVRAYAEELGTSVSEVATRLHGVIGRSLRVVLVTSDSWDEVADVFERLNDRGKGLSTLDLLRTYVISKAPEQQQDAIEEFWSDVYELSDSAAKVDGFLRHVWISLRGDVKSRSLYKEIKAVMEDETEPDTVRDSYVFSSNLASDTVLYKKLLSAEHPNPEATRHLRAISLTGASALMPAALSGLASLSEEDQVKLFRALVSTFVRFNIIGGGESTELEAAVYAAARDLRGGAPLSTALDHLRPLLRSDEDVESAFQSLVVSRAGYQRYFLEEFERYLVLVHKHGGDPPDPQEEAEIGPAGSTVLWIEHVYPQSPERNWGRWDDHDDYINRLGNLTLIHKRLNAAAKNGAFAVKKPIYAESQLRLNSWINSYDDWGQATIDARQAALAVYVPKIWERF